MSDSLQLVLLVLGVFVLWLLTKPQVWVLGLGLGGLASAFSAIASIIHFQILAAMGFTILTFILWGAAAAIAEYASSSRQ